MKTHLIIPDPHAHFQHTNERADWVAKLIMDVQPDVVICIGDSADMPSLSGYDKGRKTFQGRTYKADIEAHLDFQDRVWFPIKARKKKMPRRVFTVGNHENRIDRAIDIQPELEGTISLKDLCLYDFYDEVVDYNSKTPGVIDIDGVFYAHYFLTGISGKPISGEHPATSLLTKQFASCTCGHSHLADWSIRTDPTGRKVMASVVGCYIDFDVDWAGESNKLWWRGIVVKRNVEDGSYDPEWIGLDRIRKAYGA